VRIMLKMPKISQKPDNINTRMEVSNKSRINRIASLAAWDWLIIRGKGSRAHGGCMEVIVYGEGAGIIMGTKVLQCTWDGKKAVGSIIGCYGHGKSLEDLHIQSLRLYDFVF
nr:hypothetical protein [Tanacetum cinerariifolium]